jgi:uncharacterized repeat protein (TIGR03943 family)
VNRQAQGVLLLLVGGAVLRASLSDLYLRYVREGLRPFLIAAGLLLVAAAVATLWYELRPARPPAGEPDHAGEPDGHDHADDGHGHREPRVAWLLVLPVLALLLVAPPALGSYAAGRSGTALPQPASNFPPLPAGDPVELSVLDYATRAVYDDGRMFGTRRVKLSGFVMVGRDGAPFLTRMVLSCCAADASPVKIGLSGQVPAGLRVDGWIEVVGTFDSRRIKDDVDGGAIPFIQVSESKPIAAPHNQYES